MVETVDVAHVKVGDTFLLKSAADWQQDHCTIREGTLVTAQVTTLRTTPQPLVLGLSFAPLPCIERERGSVRPVLIALQSEKAVPDTALSRMDTAGQETRTIAGLFSPYRQGVQTATDPLLTSSYALNTTSYAGLKPTPPDPLRTGEVRGMRGVAMELPNGSVETKLTTHRNTLSLRKYANFLLLFSPVASTDVPHTTALVESEVKPAEGAPRALAAIAPEQPLNACTSNDCVELSSSPAAGGPAAAAWSISLAQYGLRPRLVRQVVGFEQSASILPLGNDQLLVTFDLHTLVRRSDTFAGTMWHPRNVRAVLLSRARGEVLAVRTWVVSDDLAQPDWSLGDGRIVAHVGSDLVIFGPGLVEGDRFHLPGPLLFLSASTGGRILLAATVHERHSRADHEKLATVLMPGESIAEDYDLTGLDSTLHAIGTRQIPVEPVEPALVADAQFTTKHTHADVWQLDRSSWAGETRPVTTLRSGCDLQLRTLTDTLLLARGCARNQSVESWFDVLNPGGSVVIHSKTGFGDLLQQADADRAGQVLAVATSHFDRDVRRGERLSVRDFASLTITLYSVHDGKPIFSAHLPRGSSQQQTFSLAPDAASIAVMTGDTVQILRVPLAPPALAMH